MSHFDELALEAELLTQDFRNMYVEWGRNTPARTGLHASSVLVKDSEWCLRQHVLHNLYPEQGEAQGWNYWDWKKSAIFENGWRLHQRWQDLFRKHGNVVWSPAEGHPGIPPALLKTIDGKPHAPELDLTHFDSERNLYFSPDAIIMFGGIKYVVEIKGVKQESYVELTDDLEQACNACETVHKAREQCNLYMHLLGLSRGIILVENKSNQDFRLYVIEYERERVETYVNRIYAVKGQTTLVRAHGPEKLPARPCQSVNETRAKACPMRKVCFQERRI